MARTNLFFATTFAAAVALAGVAAPAGAASVGFYGTFGGGAAGGNDEGGTSGSWDWDRDTTHAGGGLTIDTSGGYSPINYRLGLGWEHIEAQGERGEADRALQGLVIDNDLTFDVLRGPASRFWVGPELRLGFLHGSLDDSTPGDRNFYAAGVGPVLGFDLGLGPGAALSWKFGYLYTWYYTDDDSWDSGDHNDHAEMDEGHAFVTMALLFRLWEGPHAGQQGAPPPGVYQPRGRW
ncbi:MAG TPA: hypothetical protein VI078_16185 [bacterium]